MSALCSGDLDEPACGREATHTSCDGFACPAHLCRCSKPLPRPVPLSERCHYAGPDGRPCDGYRGHDDGPHEALWDAPTYQVLRAGEPREVAVVLGRWPGDETDEEFDRSVREFADQHPTRVRAAESAKVAPCPLCRVPVPKRLPAVGPLDAFAACPGCHAVLVWRASDEWEATGLPTRSPEPSAWQREATPDAPRSAARPAEGVSSVAQRETSSPESAHASDEGPTHTATPPRGACPAQTSSMPAAAEKRLDTMSGKNDPTTTPPRRHTRRGPSPYPGCTHPDGMLSLYVEELADTPWPCVHTGAICGRCGALDVVPIEGLPRDASPHLAPPQSQREAFVAAMDGAIPDRIPDLWTSGG